MKKWKQEKLPLKPKPGSTCVQYVDMFMIQKSTIISLLKTYQKIIVAQDVNNLNQNLILLNM